MATPTPPTPDISSLLPDSLNLPPHLSAHKYFLVCTLTVAAWDTLVLSPRTWRLLKSPGWPILKVIFHFLRLFMPAEFIVVAVAFFDTKWTQDRCQSFYLFEPICTAILLAAASAVHVIRITAIYNKQRGILALMGLLFAAQVVVTGIACGFFRSVPLKPGQGCIAGPKHNWVGIYWVAPTLLYTVSFGLALVRSLKSLQNKPLSPWKLMLRDGLNLYGAIWLVNMVNMLFWFIMTPTGPEDPVKTIVTSMAAVLTTSMTLRIILSVRGKLDYGGSFALSGVTASHASRSGHVVSGRSAVQTNMSLPPQNIDLADMRSKPEVEWASKPEHEWSDNKSSVNDTDAKPNLLDGSNPGVKITVDREVDYDKANYRRVGHAH
ncbi:hypothetical protein AGABI2DRAFT_73048 [Agaricus bisporus var. bisporus H97]|uniref:hypothetical protein n=1 Tax=Agaricus bisporus var. bisporus (strain H97 / ATCC MYA-4626 / FGSC 10389) TaxID=936046 RepID=UPI00029F5407|nr:hypothetical protein AGABI2DRAFT_73048 [Agaricus bisporus var. bisporus H97]EKV45914.1 hypothetical protein AGABI2DRAFT_73048 [Agaricus bisporus var. bisporus H97]